MNCRNIIATSGSMNSIQLGIKSNQYDGDFSFNIVVSKENGERN